MVKTMTAGELINELSKVPPNTPIFTYDMDKERDMCVQKVELNGPVFDPDDEIIEVRFNSSPYYCKGVCNIEDYWRENGSCPVICLRELHPKEMQNSN